MTETLDATGLKTKRDAVEQGLRALLRLKRQAELHKLRGEVLQGFRGISRSTMPGDCARSAVRYAARKHGMRRTSTTSMPTAS